MRYLLHDVFLKALKKYKNNTAVQHENGEKFTYENLNNIANYFCQILDPLKPKPISTKPFVGILAHVNAYSVAAVLGTLKIGGAYVPIDDQSPEVRIHQIIHNLQLDILIIDIRFLDKFRDLLQNIHLKYILVIGAEIDKPAEKIIAINVSEMYKTIYCEPANLNQVADDLAYILHSSGSTGVPKGIMLTHRNARTFVDWMQKEFQLNAQDIVMSRAPLKFDLSVFDIFNTLAVGATLICYDWHQQRPAPQKHLAYVALLEQSKATFLYTTPSTFMTLLNHGKLGENFNNLRTIMYAGEPFPVAQLMQLQNALPTVKIANIYGPTETNIITYHWIENISADTKAIPLGKVVDDTEILVVEPENLKLCKPGEIGELWCRGGTVTLGYLGDEKKTQEHFVQSPFHPYPAKFWRTGDYGYKDENNNLHYRGRKDQMVKIKGYRVEIGEVESAIAELIFLDEFCVLAIEKTAAEKALICIYASKTKTEYSEDLFIQHLSQKLPAYMIPESYHFYAELPKTSSGKIDRMLLSNHAALGVNA